MLSLSLNVWVSNGETSLVVWQAIPNLLSRTSKGFSDRQSVVLLMWMIASILERVAKQTPTHDLHYHVHMGGGLRVAR